MNILSLDERERILEAEIHRWIQKGYTLKKQTRTDATLTPRGRGGALAADGCLTFASCGLWAIPAGLSAAAGEHAAVKIHVTTTGHVAVNKEDHRG